MTKRNPLVLIDGDACPVQIKQSTFEICNDYQLEAVMVISYAHMSEQTYGMRYVLVDSNREEVDLYIMNHVNQGDVVITQDHALASILVAKGVYVISPRGKVFREEEMERMLFERFVSAKQRRAGNRTKGPSKFTETDHGNFCFEFKKILSNLEGFY
ncbi:YaiI/YqxD family protein [Fictibacillus gelatini]|uniref:YaiI/YqxD family protein n=1 Tax=Fictibacillus gelatini TaxID=225985 RepID=UPI000416EC21|nr:DUF188 domain-containing protein [Fictibacillus gelatini]